MKLLLISLILFSSWLNLATAKEDTPLEKMIDFARAGDVIHLEASLAEGVPIDGQNNYTETALMNAADAGKMETLNALILHGASLNVLNKDKRSALFFACFMKHEDAALRLIEVGADCDTPDKDGNSPLIAASINGLEKTAEKLLAHGADISRTGQAGTALVGAVDKNHTELAKTLLLFGKDKGLDLNAKNHLGCSAIIYATGNGNLELVQSLVYAGADVNQSAPVVGSLLTYSLGWPDVCKFLLDHGADINAEDKNGDTLLTVAGQRGNRAMVAELTRRGAKKTKVTLNVSPYPFTPLPLPKRWALATTALRTQCNRDSHELLGGNPPDHKNSERQMLVRWWGVHNRNEAIKTLEWLHDTGHRTEYARIAREFPIRHENWAKWEMMALCHTTNQNDPVVKEALRKFRILAANHNKNAEDDMLAWDYSRYIFVAGTSYVAGYLSEDEAWEKIMPVARRLQTAYNSWQDMGESYLMGRDIWGGSEQPEMREVYKLLIDPTDPNSPWNNIPWATDLGSDAPSPATTPTPGS